MTERARPDGLLLLAAFVLLTFGLTMVFSASAVLALNQGHGAMFFFIRQCERAAIGLLALVLVYKLGPARWHRLAPPILIGVIIFLLVLLTPPLRGDGVGVTYRWVKVLWFNLQPSELLKLALVLHLARLLARRGGEVATTRGLAAPLALLLFAAFLVAKQPNVGTAGAIGIMGLGLLFVAGARLRHLAFVCLVGVAGSLLHIHDVPYEWKRLMDFLHGHPDPQGSGYQLTQSLIALGSGGLFGKGFGDGMQKYAFLPDPHTDFIFAIVGEEGGFVVAGLVLGAYVLLVSRAFAVAASHPDRFGSLVAAGLGLMFTVHVLLNVAVVTGLAPTTGLPLPFLSYGGSSLVVNLAAVGILLRLSAERVEMARPLGGEVAARAA